MAPTIEYPHAWFQRDLPLIQPLSGLITLTPSKSLSLSVRTTQSFVSVITAIIVSRAPRGTTARFAIRHEPGPGETRFFVDGKHATDKQRWRRQQYRMDRNRKQGLGLLL